MFLFSVSAMLIPLSARSQEDASSVRTYWLNLASKAWEFYAPGQALNTQTGLYAASLDWPYFTEWDVGTQLQALLDARALGLLPDDGQWGFDNRIVKLLDFLKIRELTNNNVPYLLYDSRSGKHYQDTPTFSIDEGNLYLALYKLSTVKPNLAQDINYIIKIRNNNTDIIPDPKTWLNSTDLYCYYIAHAFKTLQFEGWNDVPSSILGTIVSQPNITTYGIRLPSAHICSEPLIETIFEVNPQDSRFYWLASQIYQAHEARYKSTGHFTAFSEGNTGFGNPSYIYEFVVDTDGVAWKVVPQITPIAYTKVAFSFHAYFNTTYTQNMVDYFKNALPATTGGFQDGIDETGRIVYSHIDRTNKQIMSAARYVIENLSSANPSPTPTPLPSQTESATPAPSLTPPPSPTPVLLPTKLPNSSALPDTTPTSSLSTLTPLPQNTGGLSNELLYAATGVPIIMIVGVAILLLKRGKNTKTIK